MGKNPASDSVRNRRLADMSVVEEEPDFLDQFAPEDREEPDPLIYDLGDEDRLIQRMVLYRNQVVHFAVMHETWHEGEWHLVARFDTCHSVAHLHRFSLRDGELSNRPYRSITSIGDVEDAYDHAIEAVSDEMDENKRRWRR